jgi:hypothetical protein
MQQHDFIVILDRRFRSLRRFGSLISLERLLDAAEPPASCGFIAETIDRNERRAVLTAASRAG